METADGCTVVTFRPQELERKRRLLVAAGGEAMAVRADFRALTKFRRDGGDGDGDGDGAARGA